MSADDFTARAIALFTLAERVIGCPAVRARGVESVTVECDADAGVDGDGVLVEVADPPSRTDLVALASALGTPVAKFRSTATGVGVRSAWALGPHVTIAHWEDPPVPCCHLHASPDGCDKAHDAARDDVTGYHEVGA